MTDTHTPKPTPLSYFIFLLRLLRDLKRSFFSVLFCLPISLLSLLLLLLLAYNGFAVFWIHVPFPVMSPPKPAIFSPENSTEQPPLRKWSSVSSSSSSKLASSVLYAVKEEIPPANFKTHLPLSHKTQFPLLPTRNFSVQRPMRAKRHKRSLRSLRAETPIPLPLFATRLRTFFAQNSTSSCKVRFFMTWISSLKQFGKREVLVIESLFKSHPDACLVIVSKSLDSYQAKKILNPFLNYGFRVMAIAPDYDFIFKDTHGEIWFNRLRKGDIDPGEVSLGQNLSNLLRLVLLYKFGGIYIDADVMILKSFARLKNTIGAQNFDSKTGNWSRLNNAVLIFDKKHPLLFKFIEDFALTFDGNKWGHNGPYLVSRVVSRVTGRTGFNFTVLPPSAFYPVDWSRIGGLFQGPQDDLQSKWSVNKLEHIQKQSFAVHLWNRHSRRLAVEKGSVIDKIMSNCCIFCNSSLSSL